MVRAIVSFSRQTLSIISDDKISLKFGRQWDVKADGLMLYIYNTVDLAIRLFSKYSRELISPENWTNI